MTTQSSATDVKLKPAQTYELGKNQSMDITVSSGQNVNLQAGEAVVKSMAMGSAGELLVTMSSGATLVVKNFSQVASMEQPPTITLANGQVINLAELLPTLANNVAPAAGDEKLAAQEVLIEKPQAKQDVVVKLDGDQTYKFGFAMDDATSVQNKGGQLVISFADGGKIIIPNYGTGKQPTTLLNADGSVMEDVAAVAAPQKTQMADIAKQLAEVEPAAGDAGGGAGAANGGFGFQSAFRATPLESISAIGPIAPTALQYVAPDRTYEPPAEELEPIVLNLQVADSQVYEDGSTQLNVSAVPDKSTQSVTVTITGFDSSWTVDTTTSGGTYDAATGTWTITLPEGVAFSGGPTVLPPANSDGDMLNLQVTLTVDDSATEQTASTVAVVNVYTDAVADLPNALGADASGDEDTAIPLNFSASVTDTDGSETLTSILISGVPAGATLSNGVDQGGGVWLLTPAQLAGLTITPPLNYSGTFPLTMTVTATETNLSGNEFDLTNNVATNAVTINVGVNAVADEPSLEVQNAQVKEDGSVQLSLQASLNDTDGSEVLTVSIAGFQPGWGVDTSTSGGTYNAATGVWTLTLPAGVTSFSGGPIVSPPANSDADLSSLTVTATATETSNGNAANTTGTMSVVTDAVVDAITINAADSSGAEDTVIPLSISLGASADTDGSEDLGNIIISGIPGGFTLNQGQLLQGGNWLVTPAQLTGLTISAPKDFNGTLNLTVSVGNYDVNLSGSEFDYTDNEMTVTDNFSVTFTPAPDQPTLAVDDVQVKEDGSVQLVIDAGLTGPATDYLVVTITGIQPGWGVDTSTSGGTYNAATGTWTVTVAAGQNYSGGPTFSPPANSDADLTGLQVTATEFDPIAGGSASTSDTANIVTDAVVDAITVDAQNASGNEDANIPLSINIGASGDVDSSEQLKNILISGVPSGATLNNGANLGGGVWQLTQADLVGLTIKPPLNWSGTFNLTVAVTNEETNLSGAEFDYTDNKITVIDTMAVAVNPVADQPNLSVKDVWVKEDGSVQLNFTASLKDTDGSETLTVTVTGIQAGWTVNTSTSGGTYNAATGTWTLTLPAGVTTFSGGPTVSPPANSDADMTGLTVTATSTESGNGSTASNNATMSVFTDAVVDPVTVTASNASGNEGSTIALTINVGASADTDGSEKVTKVVISGVPAGATLNHGTLQVDGTWLLTKADLAGLTLTPAAGYNGTINLTVRVTEQETVLSGAENDLTDNTAVTTANLSVNVNNIIGKPTVNANDVWVKEDGSVQLVVQSSLTNPQAGDTLTVTISGIQAGWTVNTSTSGGTYNAATGIWTLTLPAGVTSFNGGPTFSPPANKDTDLTGLVVTATASDGVASSSSTDNASIFTDAVVDPVTVTASNASGNEGSTIALTINVGASADTDGSEKVTKVVISGVPTGATLNKGTLQVDGTWLLSKADLAGLTLTPAAGYNGTINLTVRVTEQETVLSGAENDLTDNTAVTTANLSVNVNNVIGKPTVCGYDVWVKEDGSVQLNTQASLTNPQAGDTLTVSISGIQAGWTVNTSTSGGTYNAATGIWTLTLPAGVTTFSGGPTVKPPANKDTDMTGLVVTATASDGVISSSATDTMSVFTDAVVDPVTVTASNASGEQGAAIDLTINVGNSADTDGSEGVTKVVISGVPTGATLNHGTLQVDGTWLLSKADLSGLKITPAANFSGTINLTVAVTEQETNLSGSENTLSDNTAVTTAGLSINVIAPKLIVGENVDDNDKSTTPYEVGGGTGVINGNGASDILVGDVGGSSMENVDKDYNVVLILDVSGSMQGTKIDLLKQAVTNLLADLDSYQGGDVKVFIAPFGTGVGTTGTFDLSTANGYSSAVSFVNSLTANGFTNYEAPMQSAINWLQGNTSNDPIVGAETFTYFVSDGEPNRYMEGTTVTTGSADAVMSQITGSDGSNEVATLQAFGEVVGVGIGVNSTTLGRLSVIDSGTDSALNVQDPNDLSAALQGANPINQLSDVGSDFINGGDGNDIIFGDSLNTDTLALAKGLATPPGTGWEVFAKLEAGESIISPTWTRADTINYIKANGVALATESSGSGGQVRDGGDDTITGGNGNDIIFAQEGNDTITGGAGDDVISGGTGGDVFILNAVGQGVDTVKDFNAAHGDVLDIHNILSGFDPGADDLHNFVRTVSSGGNTLVQVDTNGTGSAYQTVCVLEGVTIDVDTLSTNGNLIA